MFKTEFNTRNVAQKREINENITSNKTNSMPFNIQCIARILRTLNCSCQKHLLEESEKKKSSTYYFLPLTSLAVTRC